MEPNAGNGARQRKTIRELVEEINQFEKYGELDLDIIVPDEWSEKFYNLEENALAAKEIVIVDILRDISKTKAKRKNDEDEAERKAMSEYRVYKRVQEKYDKWAYKKFEEPDESVFLSGKVAHWIKGFRDYCTKEKIENEVALKVLRFKAGKFVEEELEKIYENDAEAVDNLELTLKALTDQCEMQSDPWATITEFKRLKRKCDETFGKFIDRVLDRAMYVPWGNKSKEDKEKEKLTVLYEGTEELSLKRIAADQRKGIDMGKPANYNRLKEEAKLLDENVSKKKAKGFIMRVEDDETSSSVPGENCPCSRSI